MGKNFVQINERELQAAIADLDRKAKRLDEKRVRQIQRRNLRPMRTAMQAGSKSARIGRMVGITAAKKYAPPFGVRIGVVKNKASEFPVINAQGLAAIIEYGTDERFRKTTRGGLVTGRISTGKMPAFPWLRRAYDGNVRQFVNRTAKDYADEVDNA